MLSKVFPHDPSDALSPILVKELRQGMASRAFVLTFLILQLAMVMTLVFAVAGADGGSAANTREASWFFWMIIGATLIFMLPIMGLNALASELKGQTIELISLTRLNSLRIVFGKWVALTFQGFLFLTAILPYFVLRYFVGGINILEELYILFLMAVLSLTISSIAVGISGIRTAFGRIAASVAVVIGTPWLLGATIAELRPMAGVAGDGWLVVSTIIAFGLPIILYFLEIGASSISPVAENHDARKRTIYLLFCLLLFGCWIALDLEVSIVVHACALAGVLVLIRMIHGAPVLVLSLYRPFVRFGIVGRMLGRWLLYPGWTSGVRAAAFGFGILLLAIWHADAVDSDFGLLLINIVGAILLPAAIYRMRTLTGGTPIAFAIVTLLICQLTALIVLLIDRIMGVGIDLTILLSWLPPCNVMFILIDRGSADNYALGTLVSMLVLFAILFVRSFGLSRQFKELEDEAAAVNAAEQAADAKAKQGAEAEPATA